MKLYIKTFGCRVNQVESQAVAERFKRAGYELTDNFELADVCVLNTCTVTGNADRDVEKELRQITRRNPRAKLIVSGCYAEIRRDRVKELAPAAETVPNADKMSIPALAGIKAAPGDAVTGHEGKTRAFVKIQDGCDNRCNYCIVPYARHEKTSKPLATVTSEISALVSGGFHEIVLAGINVGNYRCPETGTPLSGLMEKLFALPGEFRIRLSSIEPPTVTPELLASCAAAGSRFCRHFHVPLQAGCDKVLREMGRHYTTADYSYTIQRIRQLFPDAGIFCDLIAGYPTETEHDFQEGMAFVEKMAFSGLHVFSYSPREGTPAAALPQLAPDTIRLRAETARQLDRKLRAAFAKSLVGTEQDVIIEQTRRPVSGLSSNFVKVLLENGAGAEGVVKASITSAARGICTAEIKRGQSAS